MEPEWTYEWDEAERFFRIIGEAGGTVATTHSESSAKFIVAAVTRMSREEYEKLVEESRS